MRGWATRSPTARPRPAARRQASVRPARCGEIIALGGASTAGPTPARRLRPDRDRRARPARHALPGDRLARHGLIDAIPAAIDIAIPRGSPRPVLQAPSRIHQFDPRTFDLGRESSISARGVPWVLLGRTLPLDIVRLRHLEGSEVAWEALRRWLRPPGRSPAQLIELAGEFPRAEPALRQALEVLRDRSLPGHPARSGIPRPAGQGPRRQPPGRRAVAALRPGVVSRRLVGSPRADQLVLKGGVLLPPSANAGRPR